MTEDDTLSRRTIGTSGREFNGHDVSGLEDAALAVLFDLSVCRAFVGELSEKDERRLANAETWLLTYTDGKRNPNGSEFVEIGRLR